VVQFPRWYIFFIQIELQFYIFRNITTKQMNWSQVQNPPQACVSCIRKHSAGIVVIFTLQTVSYDQNR
jgi:hypothetical protein